MALGGHNSGGVGNASLCVCAFGQGERAFAVAICGVVALLHISNGRGDWSWTTHHSHSRAAGRGTFFAASRPRPVVGRCPGCRVANIVPRKTDGHSAILLARLIPAWKIAAHDARFARVPGAYAGRRLVSGCEFSGVDPRLAGA